MSKKKTKLWRKAIKDKNYGETGHKLFAILSFVAEKGTVTYEELNKFSYNYTRRCKANKLFTGKKFDKIKNRGYIGTNLYTGGYIGQCLDNFKRGNYSLNIYGDSKLDKLEEKFGYVLFNK